MTEVGIVVKTTKKKYGVDVPKVMTYTSNKKKSVEYVLGDQVKQYNRLGYYLQTMINTILVVDALSLQRC